MKEITNRIKEELVHVDWLEGLLPLQPDNIKVPINYSKLKATIIKHGFSVAFAVWFDPDKKAYRSVDGHTRKDILIELQSEGHKVPKTLPAYEIEADNEAHAFEILVDCFNMKSNPFDVEVLFETVQNYELDIDFEGINVFIEPYKTNTEEEEEAQETNNGGGYGMQKEQSNMIVITLSDQEQEEWLEFKEKIGKMKDRIVFYELLNFYKNEKSII